MVTARAIPLARPFLNGREEELVLDVLRSGTLAQGPFHRRFEESFAEAAGTRHAVACSSGTAGLHACLHRLGVGPGDEVVTSSFSFISSANVILFERATPVFADIDERTLNIDPDAMEAAITPRTRAIIPVHIFGYPCDIDRISEMARRHGVPVVEDACEALGAEIGGRRVGTHGNPSVYGFYPNKQLTTGEGGMITTDNEDEAQALRSIVNQGRSENGDWLVHPRVGFNFRLDEMSAAVGLAQVEKLDEMLEMRSRVAARYSELLADAPGVEVPFEGPHKRSWFIYYVRLAAGIDRSEVSAGMAARGIATRPYLPSIHLQPAYRDLGWREGMLPVTERVSRSTLALPFYPQLEDADVEYVCASLREVIEAL
ncbi:MAG TPA: DegT/DnrJ/EryC1/StrS family aminotransferase [Gaiellales bacterium]|jgi:dTDP-4-amino-4,6-dideoxygalactose transaminase|nr:DegT/DnrJ/EryC1/StrS family aminotransferase [Gaiellales bacterium]